MVGYEDEGGGPEEEVDREAEAGGKAGPPRGRRRSSSRRWRWRWRLWDFGVTEVDHCGGGRWEFWGNMVVLSKGIPGHGIMAEAKKFRVI